MKVKNHTNSFVTISKEEVNILANLFHSIIYLYRLNETAIQISTLLCVVFDGLKICDLVGVCILNMFGEKYGKESVGLYIEDGLTCFENVKGPQAENIRKDVIKILKQKSDLNITSETNIKVISFLDITLNLPTVKYQFYNKPHNYPLYVDVNSNHHQTFQISPRKIYQSK